MRSAFALVFALCVGWPASGAGQPSSRRPTPQFRLVHETDDVPANSCASAAVIRSSVSARLGFVPWSPEAAPTITLRMQGRPGHWAAHIARSESSGKRVGTRVFRSSENHCDGLTSSVVLAIAIAIDPLALSRPAPAPTPAKLVQARPEPEVAPATLAEAGQALPEGKPKVIPIAWSMAAGLDLSIGLVPNLAPGALVELRATRGPASVLLRAQATMASPHKTGEGEIAAALKTGTLAPCVHLQGVAGCVSISLGVLSASGHDLNMDRHDDAFYASAGLELSYSTKLTRRFWLRPFLAGHLPLTELRLVSRDTSQVYWTTPVLGALVGILLETRFL